MSDEEEMRTCSNCKRDIPLASFLMHEAHCKRHMSVCAKCGEPIPKSEVEEHEDEYHATVSCGLGCGERMERQFLEDHQKSKCVERRELCRFCNLDVAFKELAEHENYCGSRTEPCDECGKYVRKKDQLIHQCILKKIVEGREEDSGDARGGNGVKVVACRLKCGKRMKKRLLESHEKKECPERRDLCQFCHLEMAFKELDDHEQYCGSKTEPCDGCEKFVQKKDKLTHQCGDGGGGIKMPKKYCRYCGMDHFGDVALAAHEDQCGAQTEYCDKCTQLVMLKEMDIHKSTNCRGLLAKRTGSATSRKAIESNAEIKLSSLLSSKGARERRREERSAAIATKKELALSVPPVGDSAVSSFLPADYLKPTSPSCFPSHSDEDDGDDEIPWLVNGESVVSAIGSVSGVESDKISDKKDVQNGGLAEFSGLGVTRSFVVPPGMDLNEMYEEHLKCEEELERKLHQSKFAFGKEGRSLSKEEPFLFGGSEKQDKKRVDVKTSKQRQMEEDLWLANELQKESIMSTQFLEELGENREEQEREFLRFEDQRRAEKEESERERQKRKQKQEEDDLAFAQQLQEQLNEEGIGGAIRQGRPGGLYRLQDDDDDDDDDDVAFGGDKTFKNQRSSVVDMETSLLDKKQCSHCFKFFFKLEIIGHEASCPSKFEPTRWCEHCHQSFLDSAFQIHQVTCPERLSERCYYCHKLVNSRQMKNHEAGCRAKKELATSSGRRDTRCPTCNELIKDGLHGLNCEKRARKEASDGLSTETDGSRRETPIFCKYCKKQIRSRDHESECAIAGLALQLDRDLGSGHTNSREKRSSSLSGRANHVPYVAGTRSTTSGDTAERLRRQRMNTLIKDSTFSDSAARESSSLRSGTKPVIRSGSFSMGCGKSDLSKKSSAASTSNHRLTNRTTKRTQPDHLNLENCQLPLSERKVRTSSTSTEGGTRSRSLSGSAPSSSKARVFWK